jgi:predicted DNA-binding transcriptional regulator YafY
MADPRIRPGLRVLFDARTAQPAGLTPDAIHIIASLDRKLRETCPVHKSAIVVRDKQAAELAHEFEKNTETNAVVFFNLDVAKTWLGL